jgi:H+-transporting ATPase
VKPAAEKAVNDFAGKGFRSLGVCKADEEGNWQFAGVIPMFDPPREQAKATIESARQMGLSIKMVTGDQVAIARETSKQLGLGTNILNASALGDTKQKPSTQVEEAIEKADGFAQVFPAHKYFIINALQKRNHIVGMTGDGVNDAPALKEADCGIAVSGATDAARAAASIVLLAPGLSVIIDAIKESRKIFQRMNSYAMYRIAETLRVVLFMTLAILVFNFYPVTAVMIVMIALLNDGASLSIAYDNVLYSNEPEVWDMGKVLGISTVIGVIGVGAAFALFWMGERVFHLDRGHVQTMMYLKLSVAGHLTIFLTRTRGPWWSTKPAKTLLFAVLGTQTVATLLAVYGVFMTPLGWKYAGIVWVYAIGCALLTDPIKLLAYRVLDHFKAEKAKAERGKMTSDSKDDAKSDAQPQAAKPEDKPAEAKADEKSMAEANQSKPADKADVPEAKDKPADENPDPKPEALKAEAAPAKPESDEKPDAKADQTKPADKADDSDSKDKPVEGKPGAPAATPELVKRVHELYEQLGREDVSQVEQWDKTHGRRAKGEAEEQK